MKKISIIGAGPSGLVAAINLAKAGYNVHVHEKNKDVGMRFDDDFQGLENWTSEEDISESLKKMKNKNNYGNYDFIYFYYKLFRADGCQT